MEAGGAKSLEFSVGARGKNSACFAQPLEGLTPGGPCQACREYAMVPFPGATERKWCLQHMSAFQKQKQDQDKASLSYIVSSGPA